GISSSGRKVTEDGGLKMEDSGLDGWDSTDCSAPIQYACDYNIRGRPGVLKSTSGFRRRVQICNDEQYSHESVDCREYDDRPRDAPQGIKNRHRHRKTHFLDDRRQHRHPVPDGVGADYQKHQLPGDTHAREAVIIFRMIDGRRIILPDPLLEE